MRAKPPHRRVFMQQRLSQTKGKSVIEENSVGDDLWGKTERMTQA